MVRFPSWVVSPSTARCRSSAANSPFVLLSGMPKRTKPQAEASNRSASTRSWRISRPISASSTSVSATGIRMLRPKKSVTPFWVWGTTAACCYRLSTNTLQASSNAWAKTALIPVMRTTANAAGVWPPSSNTSTASRTLRSKS